jgi:NTP pyrophosphatase (non-canonical NTP hydrolase)
MQLNDFLSQNVKNIYSDQRIKMMNLREVSLLCEKAWSQHAAKFHINRDDVFYLLKMQEELGELTRTFLELRGSEKKRTTNIDELKKQFAADIAVLIGNALILAHHFDVDLEANIKAKFPVVE